MNRIARIFLYNRSPAVRLPKDFRFDVDEVFIRKQGSEVVLSPRPPCGAVVGLRDANPHRCSMLQYLLFRSSVASTNWRRRFLRLLRLFLFPFLPVTVAHCLSPFLALMDNHSVVSARRIRAIAVVRLG